METMKTFKHYRGFLAVTAVSVSLMLMGASQSFGDDWGGHHRYYDRDGYWDGQHHYHNFEYYHNHRGYWDQRGGVRVWINV
jgi:hypothetical protein